MHEKSEEYRHLSEKERALQRELEAMRNEKVTFFEVSTYTLDLLSIFVRYTWRFMYISCFLTKYLKRGALIMRGRGTNGYFMFSTLGK